MSPQCAAGFILILADDEPDFSSPAPPASTNHTTLHLDIPQHHQRRARPLTAHQLAVERNRQERITYVLHQKKRVVFKERRKARTEESAIWRAWIRHEAMEDQFDNSGDEATRTKGLNGPFKARGPGGLVPLEDEEEDYGEEATEFAAGLRRAVRRLDRWGLLGEEREGVRGILERAAAAKGSTSALSHQAKKSKPAAPPKDNIAIHHPSSPTIGGGDAEETDVEDDGELDDMDRELLGEMDVDEDDEDEDQEEDDDDDEEGDGEGDDGDEHEDIYEHEHGDGDQMDED